MSETKHFKIKDFNCYVTLEPRSDGIYGKLKEYKYVYIYCTDGERLREIRIDFPLPYLDFVKYIINNLQQLV